MKQLYTVKDLAEITKLSESTIRNWIFEKKIETIKIGRSVRITQEQLEKILNGEL